MEVKRGLREKNKADSAFLPHFCIIDNINAINREKPWVEPEGTEEIPSGFRPARLLRFPTAAGLPHCRRHPEPTN